VDAKVKRPHRTKKEAKMKKIVSAFFLSIVFFVLQSGAQVPRQQPVPLKTAAASVSEVQGTFTLILYGARHPDDPERVAILDREGDKTVLDPFASSADYWSDKGLPAKEALAKAERFVKEHGSFWKSRMSKVLSTKGDVIGFEIKPLYLPVAFGETDIIRVYYWPQKEGHIKVIVQTDLPARDGK
jgi:hypothetical protein